jgi:hypothetical protein
MGTNDYSIDREPPDVSVSAKILAVLKARAISPSDRTDHEEILGGRAFHVFHAFPLPENRLAMSDSKATMSTALGPAMGSKQMARE